MNLETEYLEGDIVMAKVEGFPYWPAKVVEVTNDQKYLIVFFGQMKDALLTGNDLKKFEDREEIIDEVENKNFKHLNIAIELAKERIQFSIGASVDEIGKKKVQKKRDRKAVEGFFQRSISNRRLDDRPKYKSSCAELRALFEKLSVYLSHCWNKDTTQKGLTELQQDHLRTYLSLAYPLQVRDILNEWIVQQFIIILKQMQQAGPNKYSQIYYLAKAKYKQLVTFIHSQQFNQVEVNQRRRNNILVKISKNCINIY